jgi:hypothetical protein
MGQDAGLALRAFLGVYELRIVLLAGAITAMSGMSLLWQGHNFRSLMQIIQYMYPTIVFPFWQESCPNFQFPNPNFQANLKKKFPNPTETHKKTNLIEISLQCLFDSGQLPEKPFVIEKDS